MDINDRYLHFDRLRRSITHDYTVCINSICEVVMARYSDIKGAFVSSITQDPKKGRIVTTARFVQELAKVNHFWSLQDANEWIEHYQPYFRDYTDHHGDERCYFMKNMGYVM